MKLKTFFSAMFGYPESNQVLPDLKQVESEPVKVKQKPKKNMRVCPCCGRELHIEQFTCFDREKNTREFICVDCSSHLKSFNKKELIQRLKTSCVFTGISDKIVCDFHHQFGTKEFTLSNRKKSTVGIILLEAFKCIICDSNSHRLIHEYHKEGEDYHDKISFRRDHNDSYLLLYYVNFINECYGYLKLLYGDYKKNFETYVPNPELSEKKQVKNARIFLYMLITLILVREKFLEL